MIGAFFRFFFVLLQSLMITIFQKIHSKTWLQNDFLCICNVDKHVCWMYCCELQNLKKRFKFPCLAVQWHWYHFKSVAATDILYDGLQMKGFQIYIKISDECVWQITNHWRKHLSIQGSSKKTISQYIWMTSSLHMLFSFFDFYFNAISLNERVLHVMLNLWCKNWNNLRSFCSCLLVWASILFGISVKFQLRQKDPISILFISVYKEWFIFDCRLTELM